MSSTTEKTTDLLPPGARRGTVRVDGGEVAVLRAGRPGAKPAMVLLHGGGGTAAISWYRTIGPLASLGEVIAPDFPGYGGTTGLAPLRTGADLAEFASAFMAAAGIPKAIVIGNSMGGETALQLALRHPEQVQALGLISPAGLLPTSGNAVVQFIAWLATRLPESVLARSTLPIDKIVADPARLPAELVAAYHAEAARPGGGLPAARHTRASVGPRAMLNCVLDQVSAITVPTVFLQGADDRVVAPATTEAAAARMPNAERVVLAGCGHWSQLEAPDQVLDQLRRLVARVAEGSPA